MIIDLILERKDGKPYSTHAFCCGVKEYGEVGEKIVKAIYSRDEWEVKAALIQYLIDQRYCLTIANYINSVKWLI